MHMCVCKYTSTLFILQISYVKIMHKLFEVELVHFRETQQIQSKYNSSEIQSMRWLKGSQSIQNPRSS